MFYLWVVTGKIHIFQPQSDYGPLSVPLCPTDLRTFRLHHLYTKTSVTPMTFTPSTFYRPSFTEVSSKWPIVPRVTRVPLQPIVSRVYQGFHHSDFTCVSWTSSVLQWQHVAERISLFPDRVPQEVHSLFPFFISSKSLMSEDLPEVRWEEGEIR